METAGFETVVANELDPSACETLRANQQIGTMTEEDFDRWFEFQLDQRCYREVTKPQKDSLRRRVRRGLNNHSFLRSAKIIEGDIRNVSSAVLLTSAKTVRGNLDLIAGGAPCQPFSRAGKRETVECETGRLFRDFVRVVDDLRPRWFLFENVKGLTIAKTDVLGIGCANCGKTTTAPFAVRMGDFTGDIPCPVCCSFATSLNWTSERGGSLRIILNEFESLGYKCYANVLNAADYGAPQLRERLFIVGSRDGESFIWPRPTHTRAKETKHEATLELFPEPHAELHPWRSMFDALWKNGHERYGRLDKKRAVLWVKNVVRPHDEPVTWNLDRPSPTIGAHQSAKLAIAPFGVPPEQLARQQWHVLGKRQRDLPPVFVEHAYLSDSELVALQTFPSFWYFFGTRMQRAAQIGNAVPPSLAEAVGRQILSVKKQDFSEATREKFKLPKAV